MFNCRLASPLPPVLAALVLGLCAAAAADAPLERVTLQLKWRHQFQFAGYYAAIEKGFYREVGLEVTLREAVPGEPPAQRVVSGEFQYGIGGPELLLMRAAGEPVVVVAPIFQHSPMVFIVRADSGIDNVHDLVGKRVMLEPHEGELITYLQVEGISLDRLELFRHDFDPTPLLNRSVDALAGYVTDEPFVLREAGVDYRILSPRAGGLDFYGDTLFTNQTEADQHPDRVRRFLEATQRGWAYALDHPLEMVDLILTKYSDRHSREHLLYEANETWKLIMPDVVEIGYLNRGRYWHIARVYESIGLLPERMSLRGFIFDREPPTPDLRWVYRVLAVSLGASLVLGLGAAYLLRLNRTIRRQRDNLEQAMSEIKTLRGIIPICCHCKKIRDDQGAWNQLEAYIAKHTESEFSHGICDECLGKHYPGVNRAAAAAREKG